MAPKKSKGSSSSSSATPIPDEARARAVYKQLFDKKKWIEGVKADAHNIDLAQCLARTRVLLDKQPEKGSRDREAFLKVALEVYTKLPEGCEQPPGQQRCSLGMMVARASLLQLLTEEQQLKPDQQLAGLIYLTELFSKGFTRDDWHKVWFDPRSDSNLKEDEKLRGNMVAAAAAAADQLLDACAIYGRVYITVIPRVKDSADPRIKALVDKLPSSFVDVRNPWNAEATAAKEAAKTTKSAETAKPQQDAKKVLQRESKQEQLQQQLHQREQRRAGGRDNERARDIKRNKASQEDQQRQQMLDAARKKEEEAKDDAAKVLDYLEKRLLSSGSSSSSPEQHMARLQEESRVSLDVLKKTINSLSNRDTKDKDRQELPQELQWCKQQLGDHNPSDNLLKQQLQQLQEKGSSAWLVFYDDAAAGKSGSGCKPPQALYDSWEEFEEHVVNTHLVRAPDDVQLASKDESSEQLVSDSYKLKGLLQDAEMPLADAAADAAREGSFDSSNPWVKAFEMECPLQRFTRAISNMQSEEGSSEVTAEGARTYTALGFALLQAERKQVAVGRLQQSRQPAWAVQAYHSLRLLPGMSGEALSIDHDMYVIYNYWQHKQACLEDYKRIVRPHQYPEAAANGSSDAAATFSDGLAEDNVTMLSMLCKDGLLSGPLLLALQLYLNKALGKCLDLSSSSGAGSSSKVNGNRQDGSSVALNSAAALSVLTQLSEKQQVELRCFLLRALYSCYSGLSAYVEFVQQEQQQRRRSQEVPVEVLAAKEKGKDKGELALVLTQDYYEQACVAAAVPEEHHEACCAKHHTLRLQAEAEGKPYSKYDSSTWEEAACAPDETGMQGIIQNDPSVMQRYLLQPARVEELLEQGQLKVGTKQGLKALVDALFAVGKHEHQRKVLAAPPEEVVIKRSILDKARTDIAVAVQLALHRRQLRAVVEINEEHLSDSNNSQWTCHDLKQRMRALLAQRVAGANYVLRMWLNFFKDQLVELRKEDASVQEQLRAVSDVPEKDKAGKGSKENPKEKEEQLNKKAQLVAAALTTAETRLAQVKAALSKVMTEADGYPDLIRAHHSSETGQVNPLVQILTLMSNELLGSSQPNTNGSAQQLSEALQISRLSLFDLDVWVMGHALAARRRVLSCMWWKAQPRAVLALSTEALKSHLKEGISKRAELELLAAEEEFKQTQQQQPQQSKAAGKKKKKKGGAAKQAGPSLMSRIAGSESADEDEQEAAAAKAAAEEEAAAAAAAAEEEEAAAAAAEEEEEQQEQHADGWDGKLDLSKLDFSGFQQVQQHSKARTDSRDKEHASTGNAPSSQAAAAAAAAATAAAKPAGAAGARSASAAARGNRPASAAAAGSSGSSGSLIEGDRSDPTVFGVFTAGRVCSTCGSQGHCAADCQEPFCMRCNQYGHSSGGCGRACRDCGRMHEGGGRCYKQPCFVCNLQGHEKPICPVNPKAIRCVRCNMRGHKVADCPGWCRRCERRGHLTDQCAAKACTTCGKFGHAAGSPECTAGQQRSSSSRPPAAELSRPDSGTARPAASAAAAAAGPRKEFKVGNVKLLQQSSARSREQLMAQVETGSAQAFEHFIHLLGAENGEDKLGLFARVATADMDYILQSDDPVALLEELYAKKQAGRAGSLLPSQLLPAAQRVFEQSLPQRLQRLLPADWQQRTLFTAVMQEMETAAGKSGWGAPERAAFDDARWRAQLASAEAEAALKEERVLQETKQQARQQQKQQARPPPPPQQQRDPDRRPSGADDRPGSSGGSSSWGPAPQPQPASAPTAAAADRAGPAKVSFAAATQQAQEQPAAPGISMPPTLVASAPPDYLQQQQQPAAPYAGMPGQPAPAGQPWPPGMGPAGQQQQQAGDMGQLQPLPPHAFSGELQPWMLWYTHGATRAVEDLVADAELREHVLEAGVRTAPDTKVAPILRRVVRGIMTDMVRRHDSAHDGFITLGVLVEEAFKMREPRAPPVPSPAPQPAPVAGLPPHLQRSYQQQPAAGGAPTHMLPPHLQHHNAPQQQQQPLWQAEMQQQQPAGGGDDSDDDDGLMNLLTGSGTGATAAAAGGPSQQQPAWGSASGQQQQQGGSGVGSEYPALGVERGSGGGGRAAVPGLGTAGLANETGEYNCFLNVVVQCLYNCRDFRNSVWELPSYVAENPVVVALRKLFMDMQQAESGWQPGGERAVVNPTALREALDSGTQFKQQEMNDANELLDALYECFKLAQNVSPDEPGSRGVLVDSCFGLKVSEAVKCRLPQCGKVTHIVAAHWEHMLVVNTMALTFAAYEERSADMGRLLRTLFDQEMKMCDRDCGGCGTPYPPERACEATPRVLTLQLVWNQDVSSQDIEGALQHVQEHVDITPLYVGGCEVADTTYQLSSAVAYYGQHYMAFVHNTKLHTWLLFDDASVSVVGSWQDVIKKCTAGKIQPSVLFYQTLDLAAVGTAARPAAAQGMPQVQHAAAPMPMGMPAGAAGGPQGAGWAARPPAAAMPAGVPPHLAMPPHLQQQPHPVYQQPHMQQQQPVPAGPYSQPPPQQQQQQQQQLAAPSNGSGGWPAAAAATDGSIPGGSWHTVQQPADAGAAWGSTPPTAAAPAAAGQPPHAAAPGVGPPPSQGQPAVPHSPAKAGYSGAVASRAGAGLAAAAIRSATSQQSGRPSGPSATPGGGRGSSSMPRTTGPPPAGGGRGEAPYGRGAGRGRA